MHDLHEASTYLYASTGTGPYNEAIDPITIDEWWLLAKTEVMEMTKRGVPGVWTYGFYDGWTPNYMFFIAHSHNAVGRFYEVMSYGPDTTTVRAGATTTSREWFRPNPPLPSIAWGPRNNTNIQQSALLIALNHVARNKDTYLENYWLKNKRAVDKGLNGPTFAWVIPAGQRRKADAADAVNELRRQGLEVQVAAQAFTAGKTSVEAGDYMFVHAGVRPGVPLASQRQEDLLWIRDTFLDSALDHGKVVVHGHTPVDAPEVRPNRIGVDTGAFASGVLTSVVLEGESRRFLCTGTPAWARVAAQ
jgi:hypothetical protein